MYVAYVLNNCASASIKHQTPLFVATGQVNDISPMLEFVFGEPVYYCLDENAFPLDSRELLGNFVGISEHVGHKMMFKVLSNDTQKILHRSKIRSAFGILSPAIFVFWGRWRWRADALRPLPPRWHD